MYLPRLLAGLVALLCVLAVVQGDTFVDDFLGRERSVALSTLDVESEDEAFMCDTDNGGFTGQIFGGCHVVKVRGTARDGCAPSAEVGNGYFHCRNGASCGATCLMQLDGTDKTSFRSFELNVDLLELGSGMRLFASSNIATTFTIRAFTTESRVSKAVGIIPSNPEQVKLSFDFAIDFVGNADFQDINVIELVVPPLAGLEVSFRDWQFISPTSNIRGQVYQDCHCDVTKTEFDEPLQGVAVSLQGDILCETQTQSATTNAFGVYEFTDLPPCDYMVIVDQQDLEHDLCDGSSNPRNLTLSSGSVNAVNFESDNQCRVPGNIRGRVYEDQFCDAIEDEDVGVFDVLVTLLPQSDCLDSASISTRTDSRGYFNIRQLYPCSYRVVVPAVTGRFCPTSSSSELVSVPTNDAFAEVFFRIQAPSTEVVDDFFSPIDILAIPDTLGVRRTLTDSSCEDDGGQIVGGCHVLSITGVGSFSCGSTAQINNGALLIDNKELCPATYRLKLDGLITTPEVELGFLSDFSAAGDAMRIFAATQVDTTIQIIVYSDTDSLTTIPSSFIDIVIPADTLADDRHFDVKFEDFLGDANFSQVRALEVVIEDEFARQVQIREIQVIDTVDAEIGGTVFEDCTCTGRQDPTDALLEEVEVTLTAVDELCDFEEIVTLTDDSGKYLFTSLPPCEYVVSVDGSTCDVSAAARLVDVSVGSRFDINFGIDQVAIHCPDAIDESCAFTGTDFAGVPRVCGTTDDFSVRDVYTCNGQLDSSLTVIERTFSARGASCTQTITVVPSLLPGNVVDDFNVDLPLFFIDSEDIVTISGVTEDASILGGVREILLQGSSSQSCFPQAQVAGGKVSFINGATCTASATLRYDGNADVGRDFDLNATLADEFSAFQFETFADKETPFVFSVWSSVGQQSQVELTAPLGTGRFVTPFDAFRGNADFEQVNAIELFFAGDSVADIDLTYLRVVAPNDLVSVSGTVFRDRDCDRVLDPATDAEKASGLFDKGLPHLSVRLTSSCSELDEIVETNEDGYYEFDSVLFCEGLIIELLSDIVLCDVEGNTRQRVLQTLTTGIANVDFSIGCVFESGQVCGDRCNPFGDALPDGTFIAEGALCGNRALDPCFTQGGIIVCQDGQETTLCPNDGLRVGSSTCGEGRCGSTGVLRCQSEFTVDSCTPRIDGTIVDQCGAGGPCPGLGQVLCIDGKESGDCTRREYALTGTECGEGLCRGFGEILCKEDGSIQDTCTPAPDGTVVAEFGLTYVCRDGIETDRVEPCDLISCNDFDPCTEDECVERTSDCLHDIPEECTRGRFSARLDDAYFECTEPHTSLFSYTLKTYSDAVPVDTFAMCLDGSRFLEATSLIDVATGEAFCNIETFFDTVDPQTGVSGLVWSGCGDLAGRSLRFDLLMTGTYQVDDFRSDDVIVAPLTTNSDNYVYRKVLGPFDCDCASPIEDAVDPEVVAFTDGVCSEYPSDDRCTSSVLLLIEIFLPNQDLDEPLFELQLASLVLTSRWNVQVEEWSEADDTERAVVVVRLFGGTARSAAEISASVVDELGTFNAEVQDTYLEGAFVVDVQLSNSFELAPPSPIVIYAQSSSSAAPLCVNAVVLLCAVLVALAL